MSGFAAGARRGPPGTPRSSPVCVPSAGGPRPRRRWWRLPLSRDLRPRPRDTGSALRGGPRHLELALAVARPAAHAPSRNRGQNSFAPRPASLTARTGWVHQPGPGTEEEPGTTSRHCTLHRTGTRPPKCAISEQAGAPVSRAPQRSWCPDEGAVNTLGWAALARGRGLVTIEASAAAGKVAATGTREPRQAPGAVLSAVPDCRSHLSPGR